MAWLCCGGPCLGPAVFEERPSSRQAERGKPLFDEPLPHRPVVALANHGRLAFDLGHPRRRMDGFIEITQAVDEPALHRHPPREDPAVGHSAHRLELLILANVPGKSTSATLAKIARL